MSTEFSYLVEPSEKQIKICSNLIVILFSKNVIDKFIL